MKLRFKTIKALKKELGIREEYSGILVFKGQDYGIINEMLWLFNGEEEVCRDGTTIDLCCIFDWKFHCKL